MAQCVITAKYPPHIDPTKTPLAYGDRALPRLNRELQDENLLTRQRAVLSLCDYLHDPEHIAEALRTGVIQSLKDLLIDSDVTVRQKSTECLYVIAGHEVGREAFLKFGIISPLSMLFDDSEDIARKNAHKAMEMISETPMGADGIVGENLIDKLVDKLPSEHDEIKVGFVNSVDTVLDVELILDTLHFCMRVDTKMTLMSGAMKVFTDLLAHGLPSIRAKAARDIMDLSVPLEGKNLAVEVEAVRKLVELLSDSDPDVRANAAGALAMITITTKGKYTAIKAEAIGALVKLVDDPTSEVRLNALKALTCLSEAPEGREVLLTQVEKIEAHLSDHIPAVVKAATIAVKVITWKP